MFTQAGANAIAKMVLIIVFISVVDAMSKRFFDYSPERILWIFFLITYIVNYEKAKAHLEKIKNILGPPTLKE